MDDAAKKIIRDLAKNHARSKIIAGISDVYRLEWEDAASLVQKIEIEHHQAIYGKLRPFYLLLSSLSAAGGLLLSGAVLYASLKGLPSSLVSLPAAPIGKAFLLIIGALLLSGGIRALIKITSANVHNT